MEKSELRRMFSAQPETYYNFDTLKKDGFSRRKCPKCNNWFWSTGKETCGDTPCEGGYTHLGKADLGWDFLQAIERWEKFFEKNRHKVVEPYPIVAKWRPDLFFVIASIADFQPWVLKGIAEPPGNPLVISQPCLRFLDLDNVGRTGRHFSQFFMGGQHAFGLPEYWQNETVGFGLRFLLEEMKIPIENITYREDVWSGGGNFGPSVEAFAGGVEIVNHVFMQFEDTPDGNFKPMERKVVDTGWGLEKLPWYVTGKSNAYEAVFPNIAKHREDLGIVVDWEGQREFWSEIGIYDVSEGAKIPKHILTQFETIKPLQGLYTILDHTRALAFALADGAIPSNVGGGYNLRNLLRRSFTINKKYKFDLDVSGLIKEHAKYLGKRFKNLRELPDVDDIVHLEEKRYEETKVRGSQLVNDFIKKGKLKSKLIELYESHGMNPETVAEIASSEGVDIKIPDNFYLNLKKKAKLKAAVGADRGLPTTFPLYYKLSPKDEFEALVLWSKDNQMVLDQSNFYPTSGGQDHDTGTIEWKTGSTRVVNVEKDGKSHIITLDKEAPAKGTRITGKVDVKRRMDLARHHTAVHIVNGAAVKVLGIHSWQAGANKTIKKATLDISHYKPVTEEEIREMEKIANEVVLENIKIRKLEMPRTAAEQKFGFRIYQGGAVPGAKLHIIHMPNHDAEACGGTHVDYSGEVGLIKILKATRIQDGIVRLELVAGMRFLEHIWETETLLKKAAEEAKTDSHDLPKAIKKLTIRVRRLTKGKDTGEVKLHGKVGAVKWAMVDMPFKQMENVAKAMLNQSGAEAIVLINNDGGVSVVSKGKISAVELAKRVSKELGGSAGGNKFLARGGGRKPKKAEEALKKLF
ncbi:MAG: alanine--tRNA ligase [Candidatus Altiarchaeota archaeon]|nr:alanine--tRNA ligase [Candidatus Altiarchaeota archaeon]